MLLLLVRGKGFGGSFLGFLKILMRFFLDFLFVIGFFE